METKANYLLIGAFTLLGFLGLLGFLAWFSKVELDKQFAYYDVYFPNVSGLDRASTVKFAGLAVGQVSDLALSEKGDGTVRVRLEVDASTPVRTDSLATIEAQGVTGVSFVGISSGEPAAALLAAGAADIPVITAGKSTLQTLTEDAPRVIDQTLATLEQINALFSNENRETIEVILQNLSSASANLDKTLTEFSGVAETVGSTVEEIGTFTRQIEGITESVDTTLSTADRALDAITQFSENAQVTLDAGTEMLRSADETVITAGKFIDNELAAAMVDMTETSATLRLRTEVFGDQVSEFLQTWTRTGSAAEARLIEAEDLFVQTGVMITDLSQAITSIDEAALSVDTLMTGDGVELLRDARKAVNNVDSALTSLAATAEADLPKILEDVRSATETATRVIDTVGKDLSNASGRVDGLASSAETTLAEVTETFARARNTMDALDRALGVAETTLSSADETFVSANRIIGEDISPVTKRLGATMTRLDAALDQVSADIPGISRSVSAAAEQAEALTRQLNQLVGQVDGPLASFAKDSLPQYTAVASEARRLIKSLETLTRKIERDPARFFFGNSAPQYRR